MGDEGNWIASILIMVICGRLCGKIVVRSSSSGGGSIKLRSLLPNKCKRK